MESLISRAGGVCSRRVVSSVLLLESCLECGGIVIGGCRAMGGNGAFSIPSIRLAARRVESPFDLFPLLFIRVWIWRSKCDWMCGNVALVMLCDFSKARCGKSRGLDGTPLIFVVKVSDWG